MKERIWLEDALKHIHECEYRSMVPTAESLAGALSIPLEQGVQLLARLERSGLVRWQQGRHQLTREGRNYARHVIRAHRLYETHLAQETGVREERWHEEAERREHEMTDRQLEELAARLGDPRFDPHGDPIPTPDGKIPPARGTSLVGFEQGWEGRIVHVEDEPPNIYAQIVAGGLAPGMRIRVAEVTEDGMRINAEGRLLNLTMPMARRVMATPLAEGEHFDEAVTRLSSLRTGERASIIGLSPACRGPERNRMLDLGIVPGSDVEIDMSSPSGNPTAYVIRGASIALRREQAERVLISRT